MAYEDFIIRIGPKMGDSYHVRVEKSPAGEGRSTLELPVRHRGRRSHVGRSRTYGARSVGGPGRRAHGRGRAPPGPAEVGKQLYNALFQGEVQERFISSLARVDERGSALRIRLKMDLDEPGLADVASLPWELLYPGAEKGFLNTSESTPVIRSLDVGQPTRPYPFQPPMRILVVIANPEGSADLDLTEERAAIEASWGKLPRRRSRLPRSSDCSGPPREARRKGLPCVPLHGTRRLQSGNEPWLSPFRRRQGRRPAGGQRHLADAPARRAGISQTRLPERL